LPFRREWLKRDDFSVIGNISKTPFSEGCGYYFTFLANEKTILLFRQKRIHIGGSSTAFWMTAKRKKSRLLS